MVGDSINRNHGLKLLFLMQICEGFSFYGAGAILTLFMTQFLNLSLSFAFLIYGVYCGVVYLSTLVGGYLSDKYIGSRYLLNIGIISMILGLLILSYDASLTTPFVATHSSFLYNTPEILLLISLLFIIIGEGFMRVNISSTVPQLYKSEDREVESSFTLLTMAINIGALSACMILGLTIGEGDLNLYKYGFLILAISSIVAVICYNIFRNKYLVKPNGEKIGLKPIVKDIKEHDEKECISIENNTQTEHDKNESNENNRIILTKQEKNNIKIILISLGMSLIFFTGFEVMDSTLMFFAKDHIVNTIPFIPFKISPEMIKFIEPFGVIVFTPMIINYFSKRQDKFDSLISKMILGIFTLLLVYIIFFIPCSLADAGNNNITILFIIIMEFARAISEILFLPIILSLISKLSPKQYLSRLMGMFYCSLAAAYTLSGIMAGFYPNSAETTQYLFGIIHINNFKAFCLIFIAMYLILLIISYVLQRKIKKMT